MATKNKIEEPVCEQQNKSEKEKSFSNIGLRSFLTVVIILTVVIFVCGALSYFIPQGEFEYNEDGTITLDFKN